MGEPAAATTSSTTSSISSSSSLVAISFLGGAIFGKELDERVVFEVEERGDEKTKGGGDATARSLSSFLVVRWVHERSEKKWFVKSTGPRCQGWLVKRYAKRPVDF